MSMKHRWYTLSDKSWNSIDFSVSENTDQKGKALAVLQFYTTENGDNETIGNMYIDENKLDSFIKDLQKVKRQMTKANKLVNKD